MIASSATAKTEQDLIMIQTITSNKLKPTITTTPNSQKPFTHKETNSLRRYHEALGKWEAAITLMPERAVLHQQKAQVLLEIGEAWNALKAATQSSRLLLQVKDGEGGSWVPSFTTTTSPLQAPKCCHPCH
ncbi:uncharacterized protein LOC114306759 isoform X6 [Camellia sinensis]|uniref:uncharacterized protein LOC114306759 isoform X6 n=1 Tax=Camellia sinensis TaxID=4442 RepID=UPI00103699B1|nr:uncharacterized protein LOC114306759 isoform X6 [Camellia sinensis]